MKKNLMTVLILALLVVNIVLTAVMMVSMTSTNKKTAELVTNIATVMNLELTSVGGENDKQTVSLADTEVYNLSGDLTIPLATDESGKQGYIIFEIALSMNTKHKDYKAYGDIASRESLIKDAISTVVTAHTESECRDDFEGLKEEILEAIQGVYQSDFIYNVAISEVRYGK